MNDELVLCSECRHWTRHNGRTGRDTWGRCALGESVETGPAHPFTLAHAHDPQGYGATLETQEFFACNQGESSPD